MHMGIGNPYTLLVEGYTRAAKMEIVQEVIQSLRSRTVIQPNYELY